MKNRVLFSLAIIIIMLLVLGFYGLFFNTKKEKNKIIRIIPEVKIFDKSVEVIKNKYEDDLLVGNDPIVKNNMIPVYYDQNEKVWKKASIYEKWYDYSNLWWANVVVCKDEFKKQCNELKDGYPISMDIIYGFFVWVPRFEYKLFNVNNDLVDPQLIEVNFVSINDKKTLVKNGEFYTHPAFTAKYSDGTEYELSGFWISKFEPSLGDDGIVYLLPNKHPLVNIYMYQMWQYSTSIGKDYQIDYDSRIINNMEWGAIAYLSSSVYGKVGNSDFKDGRIYVNNSMGSDNWDNLITGCSSGTINYGKAKSCRYKYDEDKKGTGASSTGNIYGIYDLSGGAWECVMGVVSDDGLVLKAKRSDLLPNESRYYSIYKSGGMTKTSRGMIGDATRETKQSMEEHGSWYGNNSYFATKDFPWIKRGGSFRGGGYSGLFDYGITDDKPRKDKTFRTILSEY